MVSDECHSGRGHKTHMYVGSKKIEDASKYI